MSTPQTPVEMETDSRFPSGKWIGFFLQKVIPPGKHPMELMLKFSQGTISGEGRDWVGEFILRGRYDVTDGRCHWNKQYLGKHAVFYRGFNEGKGIWGTWEIPSVAIPEYNHGGFRIWPEGMPDPTLPTLSEEAEIPIIVEERLEVKEIADVPAG